jgi:hypothetical protein
MAGILLIKVSLIKYDCHLATNDTTEQQHTCNWRAAKDFTSVITIALKKPKATKGSDHRIISLTTDTAKIVARMLRGIGRKIEEVLVLGEDRVDLEEEEELGMRLGSDSNIRTIFGHR